MPPVAEGANYRIELEDGIACCRVWRRADLTSEEGARCAREKIATFRKLAMDDTRGMVFDLSEAPPVTGPKTQQALATMLGIYESATKPIALVTGDAAVQKLQLSRLVSEHAPHFGRTFDGADAARGWVSSGGQR